MPSRPLEDLVAQLGKAMIDQSMNLAVAESCTGGLLAASIVGNIEASSILERGFVVYSVDSKCQLLGLERGRVEECGGVAEDIARAMARACLEKSNADVAAAITGFAGPRESDEEVGLIHIATAGHGDTDHRALHLGDIGRSAACNAAVETALGMLLDRVGRVGASRD